MRRSFNHDKLYMTLFSEYVQVRLTSTIDM